MYLKNINLYDFKGQVQYKCMHYEAIPAVFENAKIIVREKKRHTMCMDNFRACRNEMNIATVTRIQQFPCTITG